MKILLLLFLFQLDLPAQQRLAQPVTRAQEAELRRAETRATQEQAALNAQRRQLIEQETRLKALCVSLTQRLQTLVEKEEPTEADLNQLHALTQALAVCQTVR